MVIIISAMSENRVIGLGDGMPWSVPYEYEQYLRFVSGNTVVMGRKTYEIFGGDLPESTNAFVVTSRRSIGGATVSDSVAGAITLATQSEKPVFVAGGSKVYEEALPLADAMYLSTIKGEFEGDSYFPKFDPEDWEIAEERDEPEFVFRIYRRSQ